MIKKKLYTRKVRRVSILGCIAALALMMYFTGSPNAAAQTSRAGARIVWLDDPDEVNIQDTAGRPLPADFGLMLESGTTVKTGNSRVEMVLVPNGSVIIITNNTSFRIDSLQKADANAASNENRFSLTAGKLRFVAGRIIGSSYSVRTPSAVAGVRGTDFYRMYDPASGKDWLCVTEGTVRFDPPAGGQGVLVPAGYFVNLNTGFRTEQPDEEWLRSNLTLETLYGAVLPPRN